MGPKKFFEGMLAGRKKSNGLIIFGILAFVVVLFFIPMLLKGVSINEDFDEQKTNVTSTIIEESSITADEFFVRVQVDGFTIDTLTLNNEYVTCDYLSSSNSPYSWPYDVSWESDDFTDTKASQVTITIPGSPTISTVLSTPKFSVTTTGSKENLSTIVVVNSSDAGTFVFQYGETSYYFSVVEG